MCVPGTWLIMAVVVADPVPGTRGKPTGPDSACSRPQSRRVIIDFWFRMLWIDCPHSHPDHSMAVFLATGLIYFIFLSPFPSCGRRVSCRAKNVQ